MFLIKLIQITIHSTIAISSWGSLSATIGRFVFDPYLLLSAKVSKDLARVTDYASDALVISHVSYQMVSKLFEQNRREYGNTSVTAISLMMLRCCLFAVNSKESEWWIRASLSYMSLVWFTSFHNLCAVGATPLQCFKIKKSMRSETIGLLSLVIRSDVS